MEGNMELYQKCLELELVDDYKEFSELVWLRCIKLNNNLVIDPKETIKQEENYHLRVCSLEFNI